MGWCDIAKRYIAQGDEVAIDSLVQETNQKERLLRNKLVNGLVMYDDAKLLSKQKIRSQVFKT